MEAKVCREVGHGQLGGGGNPVCEAELDEPVHAGGITRPGRLGEGAGNEVAQVSAHREVRVPGIAVGVLSAWGARTKKRVNCIRERASASVFLVPGRWVSRTWKWWRAAVKNRVRRSAMMCGCLQRLFPHARTIAWLSQKNRIFRPDQELPRVRAAATMANSSFH